MKDGDIEYPWSGYREIPLTSEAIHLWIKSMGSGNREVLLKAIEEKKIFLFGDQENSSKLDLLFKVYGYLLNISLDRSGEGINGRSHT